jgi:type IV secretory pathway component VirB8
MKDARTGLAIFYQSVIIAVALALAIAFVGTLSTHKLVRFLVSVWT